MAESIVFTLLLFSLASTSSQEPLCPAAEDIAPCVCRIRGEGLEASSFLNCTDVEDEDQLAQVFKAEFPDTHIGEIYFNGNKGIKVLRNGVFGDISFDGFIFFGGVLKTIEGSVFEKSQKTLIWMRIRDTSFLTNVSLDGNYDLLEEFELSSTNVSVFPLLNCPKIKDFEINDNQFTVPESPLSQMPLLEFVVLSYNGGSTLPDVLFTKNHTNLDDLYIANDDINYLQVGPFENVNVGSLLHLNFSDVSFEMKEGALASLQGMYLEMWATNIPTLEEHLWRPLLDNDVTLVVNKIICDCSVKWLVSNPPLIDKVQYTNDSLDSYQPAKCSTGENLADLDPAEFENCWIL